MTFKSLQRLRKSEPGKRFQNYYHRHHRNGQHPTRAAQLFRILLGVVGVLAGVFFMPAPGPGSLILVSGLAVLAGEFLIFARLMDWGEVRLRTLWAWSQKWWARSSVGMRVLICLVFVGGAAAAAYGAYVLLFA